MAFSAQKSKAQPRPIQGGASPFKDMQTAAAAAALAAANPGAPVGPTSAQPAVTPAMLRAHGKHQHSLIRGYNMEYKRMRQQPRTTYNHRGRVRIEGLDDVGSSGCFGSCDGGGDSGGGGCDGGGGDGGGGGGDGGGGGGS